MLEVSDGCGHATVQSMTFSSPFQTRKLNLKSPESIEELLFMSAINRMCNFIFMCVLI